MPPDHPCLASATPVHDCACFFRIALDESSSPSPSPPPTTPPSSLRGEEAPGASQSTDDDDDDDDGDDDSDDDDAPTRGQASEGGGGADADAPPPPPGAHALRLDAAGLRQIRSSQQPAVVRFDRAGCAGCADLAPFWEQHVAASLPPGSAWWADCD